MKPLRPCSSRFHHLRVFHRPKFIPVVSRRLLHRENAPVEAEVASLRKELKDAAKKRKQEARPNPTIKTSPDNSNWELTVGIEIHAELNTSRKLFSDALAASTNGEEAGPNSNVALFDLAYPGSQPHFQYATLLPALRAALALNCDIQRRSSWDRKHYFYQDQPNGYQITQYYGKNSPFSIELPLTEIRRALRPRRFHHPLLPRRHRPRSWRVSHNWNQADTDGARYREDRIRWQWKLPPRLQPRLSPPD